MPRTRLAPSPTGALHLGNARTFLVNWVLARRLGWNILLRIEDLDGPRVKRDADRMAIEDLAWLGLDWDEGPVYQSPRLPRYRAILQMLLEAGHAYPCVCTRSEVTSAASAPHAEDGATIYAGTCRGRFTSTDEAMRCSGRPPALRYRVPPRTLCFTDRFAGERCFDLASDLGDFVIAKGDGTPAYQLAVAADDLEMGISHVVRGDDLLDSTPRQILLYEAMGAREAVPEYYHLPLVVGTDGRRLAKRHGDTRISWYRQLGVAPSRVLALLARWCGMEAEPGSMTARQLVDTLPLPPKGRVVFTEQDDRWLRERG